MPLDSSVIIEKRAGEKVLVAMDFGSWLTTDETISTINSVIFTGSSGSVTVTSQAVSGSRVVFYIEGGDAGIRYIAKVNVTTSLGQILIGEGPLRVVA